MGLLAEYEKELTACGERYRAAQTEMARLTKECDELREALARCVKYVPLVIINGRSTGNMQPTAITKAEVDLAFADKALAKEQS